VKFKSNQADISGAVAWLLSKPEVNGTPTFFRGELTA